MSKEDIVAKVAKITEDRLRLSAEQSGLIWDSNFNYMMACDIISSLDSMGVRLVVGRELPECPYVPYGDRDWLTPEQAAYLEGQQGMVDAGYEATEGLV